jgi:hypothetical protein
MIISELLGAVPIRLVRRLDNGCSVVFGIIRCRRSCKSRAPCRRGLMQVHARIALL